jgi:two-component system response regulator RstA
MKSKILLVDDDIELAELIRQFLTENNYDVKIESRGDRVLPSMLDFQPDLIILDVMLPGIDGITACKNIRPLFNGPIIMLTALCEEYNEIHGLETGADDYLCKPIKPGVLLAHIRSQLRRQVLVTKQMAENVIQVDAGNIVIDNKKRLVLQKGEELVLTCAEYDLLMLLARSAGDITSRDTLHLELLHLEYGGADRPIDLRVSRLRKKLGDNSKKPTIIKTIRNKGYLLAS